MPPVATSYRRLPGRSLNPVTASTLWVASDHLLLITSPGYLLERYRRFYFRDIQALVLHKTRRRAVINMVLGVPAAMCLLGMLAVSNLLAWIFLGVPAALLLVAASINTLRGPACITRVVTAHSDQVMHALSRLRPAEKVVAQLQPALLSAQHDLERHAAESGTSPASGPLPATAVRPLHERSPVLHRILLGLLALHAVLLAVAFFFYGEAMSLAENLVITFLYPLVLVALARQRDSTLPRPLQLWTWALLWYFLVAFLFQYAYSLTGYFRYADDERGQWGVVLNMMAESPRDSVYLFWVYAVSLAVSVALLTAAVLVFRTDDQSAPDPLGPEPGGEPESGEAAAGPSGDSE